METADCLVSQQESYLQEWDSVASSSEQPASGRTKGTYSGEQPAIHDLSEQT